jgi:hypothetical protein
MFLEKNHVNEIRGNFGYHKIGNFPQKGNSSVTDMTQLLNALTMNHRKQSNSCHFRTGNM